MRDSLLHKAEYIIADNASYSIGMSNTEDG